MSVQHPEMERADSRKRACVVVLVVVVLAIVASFACLRILFCMISDCDGPPRIPMPALATELTALPIQAHTECSLNAYRNLGEIYVWEFPSIYPSGSRDNSAYGGVRGESLGVVHHCAEIQVTDYAWSEVDGEFWVLIESEQAAGWIPFEYVTFDISRSMNEFELVDVDTISRIMEEVDDPAVRSLLDANFASPAMRALFDVYIHEDRLVYVKSPCSKGDLSHRFFLHISPVDLMDLAEEHVKHGFGVYDFYSSDENVTAAMNENGCIVALTLPEYDIQLIHTGQVIREESATGEVSWKGPIWDGAAIVARERSK